MEAVKTEGIKGISPNFSGRTLIKDPDTGYMVPGQQYTLKGFTPERKQNFIRTLQELGTISATCRVVGIHHQTYQNHMKTDPEFRQQVENAVNEGKMQQRGEFELAMLEHGKKSNGFMWAMAWLRNKFPGEFDDKKTVTHTVGKDVLDRLESGAKKIEASKVIDAEPVSDQESAKNNEPES